MCHEDGIFWRVGQSISCWNSKINHIQFVNYHRHVQLEISITNPFKCNSISSMHCSLHIDKNYNNKNSDNKIERDFTDSESWTDRQTDRPMTERILHQHSIILSLNFWFNKTRSKNWNIFEQVPIVVIMIDILTHSATQSMNKTIYSMKISSFLKHQIPKQLHDKETKNNEQN